MTSVKKRKYPRKTEKIGSLVSFYALIYAFIK